MDGVTQGILQDYLSREDYIRTFDISSRTEANQRALRKGPPFYKIMSRIYYKRAEVMEWIESQRVDTSIMQRSKKGGRS